MKAISLSVLFLSLALSACLPPGDYGSPYQRKALADAEIQETAAARVEREAQATLQAARAAGQTEQEIARVMAPVHAKETEIGLEATAIANRAAAATLGAAETAQFFANNAAMLEAEKHRIEVQLEIDQRRRQEANAAAWDSIWRWAWPLLELAVGIAVAGALYFLPSRWLGHRIRQKSLALLSDGVGNSAVVYFGKSGEPEVLQTFSAGGKDNGKNTLPNLAGTWSDGKPVQVIGVSGDVLVSRPNTPDRSTHGQALEWVRQSIRELGRYQDQLLSDDRMGWGASKLARIRAAFGNILETIEGRGTFVREGGPYENLAELERALLDRRITLRPSPTPSRYPLAGD